MKQIMRYMPNRDESLDVDSGFVSLCGVSYCPTGNNPTGAPRGCSNKRIETRILIFLRLLIVFGASSATKIQKYTLGELHDPLSVLQ